MIGYSEKLTEYSERKIHDVKLSEFNVTWIKDTTNRELVEFYHYGNTRTWTISGTIRTYVAELKEGAYIFSEWLEFITSYSCS